jgi:hypothetical protein
MAGCGSQPASEPGTVSYAQVQQIFDTRCAGAGCHVSTGTPSNLGGGLDLSAAQAAPCTLNVASSEDPQRVRIQPGNAGASYLVCKVDPSCSAISGSRMPLGGMLSASELATLTSWVAQGATGGATGTCASPPSGGTPDTTPPTFAGAGSATGGSNSVSVQWSAATDNVTAQNQLVYLLYQASASGGENFATPSYTSAAGATSYNVGKLALSTKYYFVVRAQDQAGNIDSNKVEVSATTLATTDTMPPTFAGLTGASATGTSVSLSWSPASDNVTAASQITYLVYQAASSGGENYATSTYTTAPGATSFTVSGLTPGSTYYFVVRAEDAAGNIDANKTEKSATIAAASFSGQIQPIFTASCTGAACHAGAKPQQGLDLSSASVSYSNLVNVASGECPATKRVLPAQPTMSYLIWKLQGTGACFTGSQMPKGQPLSAANINLIQSWVAAGAPNN